MYYIVVSYDIPEDKRRTKIHSVLKSYGQWMQLSVFECNITSAQYAKLRSRYVRNLPVLLFNPIHPVLSDIPLLSKERERFCIAKPG